MHQINLYQVNNMTYKIDQLPDDKISFEHKIRHEWLMIDASIWFDEEGIYKTRIDRVWLDETNVTGLMTDDDLSDIDDAIIPAAQAASADKRATGVIAGPFPTL